MVYDGNGSRLQAIAHANGSTITATYTLDPRSGLPLVVDNGINVTMILYGQAAIGEYAVQTGEWRYYLGDAQLSVRQLVNANAEITKLQTYGPYGVLLHQAGDIGGLFGYQGGQSAANGLWYFGEGYFDPQTGQFLSTSGNPLLPLAAAAMANPGGFLLGPVLFISWRRRKKGKGRVHPTTLLLFGVLLVAGISGCAPTPTPIPGVPTPTPPPTGTPVLLPTVTVTTVATATSTATVVTITAVPIACPEPMWDQVGVFKTSAYYIPFEGDYYEADEVPILAADWYEATYLSINEGYVNNDINMAQKANRDFLFDQDGIVLQGTGKLRNGYYISSISPRGTSSENMRFSWAPQERIEKLNPLETAAVCPQNMGGLIPHPNLDPVTGKLDGETSTIKLEGEGIENFFSSRGKDNVLEVIDVGEGLCPETNPSGLPLIDIYMGVGISAYNAHYVDAVNAGEMTVYIKR
jgi:hypothetical protein